MRVHLVQMDIVWEDKGANYAVVDRLVDGAGVLEGDLVVLPEMFDTGFSFNLERTVDEDGATAVYLSGLARRLGATVHGGRTVLAEDGVHGLNRAHVVGPDGGVVASYDKMHPFSFGRESERFVGGERVVVYPWGEADGGLRVCPAVCYDLRFPELFRAGLTLGAEAYALGANWPAARAVHWRALAIARAIENQAYVFAVNRVGSDVTLSYVGGSLVVDPRGEVLAEGGGVECVVSVGVDRAAVEGWRGDFPAWRDRSGWLG